MPLKYTDFQSYRDNTTELNEMANRLQVILNRAQGDAKSSPAARPVPGDAVLSSFMTNHLDVGEQSLDALVHIARNVDVYIEDDDKHIVHMDLQAYPKLSQDTGEIKDIIDGLNHDLSDRNTSRLKRLHQFQDIYMSTD